MKYFKIQIFDKNNQIVSEGVFKTKTKIEFAFRRYSFDEIDDTKYYYQLNNIMKSVFSILYDTPEFNGWDEFYVSRLFVVEV